MSISADLVGFSEVPELVPGVTPTDADFQPMRLTGESLAFNYSSTVSNELGGSGRGVRDSIMTGAESVGSSDFELHSEQWVMDFFSGLMGDSWTPDGVNRFSIHTGDDLKTFTVRKLFPVQAGDVFHRFTGVMVDTFSMDLTPNQPITASFGLVGQGLERSNGPGTPVLLPLKNAPVMTSPLVTDFELVDPASGQPFPWVGTTCFTNATLNVNNNSQGIACIGELGTKETLLGRQEVSLDVNVLFNGDDLMQLMVDQAEFILAITCSDSDGRKFSFQLPRAKFSSYSVVASGTGSQVEGTGTITGLLGDIGGGVEAMMKIEATLVP